MAGRPKGTKNTSKVRIADNGYRFPEQLPVGEILIDSLKNEWLLGKAIARGGFGEIYEARPSLIKSNLGQSIKNRKGYEFVIKVDHFNGPLFCEMNFYIRAAKQEFISKWMSEKNIKFLGIPSFIAAGTHNKGSDLKNGKTPKNQKEVTRYRFLVMPRFGSDLQKVLANNKLRLPLKTAYTIGIKILDILEYIHSHGYIHADIKASNLLLSMNKNEQNDQHDEIWLVDFGLVEKYLQGEPLTHKPYEEDLRKANNGTIEFTSRDAHIGCFSRKGDCEILAYNLLYWLSGGRLPWMSNLQDKKLVKTLKDSYMNRLDDLLNYAFGGETATSSSKTETATKATAKRAKTSATKIHIPDGLAEFFKQVIKMKHHEKPDYKLLKTILEKAIISSGERFDGKFYLTETDKKNAEKKISPLKRKHPSTKSNRSNKSLKSNESSNVNNYSDISVILDDEESEDEEIVEIASNKRPRKTSSASRLPVSGKLISNGRSKTPVNTLNGNNVNGKQAGKQNGKTDEQHTNGHSKLNGQLLNENGVNRIMNDDQLNNNSLDVSEDKVNRRRNPSRKVKHASPALIENNKLINEPIKNGRVKSNSAIYNNKSENQIVFNGKVLINPTPAMLELINKYK